jgi:hypothetical protein
MRIRIYRELVSISILFICLNSIQAQDSIPVQSPIDSTVIDTVVIRRTLVKIKYIPRGVNLTNPVISFNKTKPLLKEFSKFRVPSFWTKINRLGINMSEVAFVNWNAGGDNSVSALGNLRIERNYKFRYIKWDNFLKVISKARTSCELSNNNISNYSRFGKIIDTFNQTIFYHQ